ncbi:MAG: histidine kinase [Lachnospiraceae bacterium]
MIYEFLMKELDELMNTKQNLESELEKLHIKIKETLQFIQVLNAGTDDRYESFFPYLINNDNHIKIEELKKNLVEYEDTIHRKENYLNYTNDKIGTLQLVLQRVDILEKKSNLSINQSQNELVGLGDLDNEGFRLKLLETQEAERQRIARDLHDSTVQNLTAMSHKLEYCSRLIDSDPNRSKIELMNASKSMRENVNDMRKIIYDLRPMALDDMGIDIAIERELGRLERESGVKILYSVQGEVLYNLPIVNLSLFRIIQEACNNAIKHAEPKNISVRITNYLNKVELHIVDDGKGFDTDKDFFNEDVGKGFGLTTMKERIYLLSGTLNITSEVGKGTDLFVTVPVRTEEDTYAD